VKCLSEFELPLNPPATRSLLPVAWLKTLNALINDCRKREKERERESERKANWRAFNWTAFY